MPRIRGFSNGIVISPKATGSQIGISIINDDMRICSTIAEGILFGKSHDYVSNLYLPSVERVLTTDARRSPFVGHGISSVGT
jgi:hypothetical protein